MYIRYSIPTAIILIVVVLSSCITEETTIVQPIDPDPTIEWLFPESSDGLSGVIELQLLVIGDSDIDSIAIYRNGFAPDEWRVLGHADSVYHLTWDTELVEDGRHILEARAWDDAGNMGISVSLHVYVLNHPDVPRVIWVPDDYETIQGAINASEDGDTVRVRAGTYREGLRLMGKNIWLESEEGPERTVVYADGWNDAVTVIDGEKLPVVRGFTLTSSFNGIRVQLPSSIKVLNCIFRAKPDDRDNYNGVFLTSGNGYIYNCIFDYCDYGLGVGYVKGEIENSVFQDCHIGFFKSATYNYWFSYSWNAFWMNDINYSFAEQDSTDVFLDPMFLSNSYHLSEGSPLINTGNPDIYDADSTRSDIGIYGGPYSY